LSISAQNQQYVHNGDTVEFKSAKDMMAFFDKLRESKDSIRGIEYAKSLPTISLDTAKLVLSGGLLTTIPAKVYELSQLERLELKGNKLTSIDKKLTSLKKLKYLDLSYNELNPDQIKFKKNKSIEYLDLSRNGLTEIPKRIKKLTGLKKIKLNENQIVDIRDLRKLKKMTDLNLSRNPVRLNEETFKKGFKTLELFTLQKCGLESLPENIGNLQSLKTLHFPENKITSLPKSIGQMDSLLSLMLYQNEVRELPKEIFNAKNLIYLDFYYNHIKEIPEEIGNLQNLENLYASFNELSELPKSMESLTKLDRIYFHDNNLTYLPDLGNLKELKILHLHNNQFTILPEWIYDFQKLEELTLSYNPLPTISDKLLQLPKLKLVELTGFTLVENGSKADKLLKKLVIKLKEKGVAVYENKQYEARKK
jgi:leucine-rich repeat protein SHOC2